MTYENIMLNFNPNGATHLVPRTILIVRGTKHGAWHRKIISLIIAVSFILADISYARVYQEGSLRVPMGTVTVLERVKKEMERRGEAQLPTAVAGVPTVQPAGLFMGARNGREVIDKLKEEFGKIAAGTAAPKPQDISVLLHSAISSIDEFNVDVEIASGEEETEASVARDHARANYVKEAIDDIRKRFGVSLVDIVRAYVQILTKDKLSQVSHIRQLVSNKDNLEGLLKILTQLRLFFDYEEPSNEFPFKFAKEKGVSFEIAPHIFVSPGTHSFRRHIIYETNDAGNIVNALELKIPGEFTTRYVVEKENLYVAEDLTRTFGAGEVVAEPVFLEEHEGEFWLYGRRVRFTREHPLRPIGFKYQDGIRIDMLWPYDETLLVDIAQRLGISAIDVRLKIVKETIKAVHAIHKQGYILTRGPDGSAPKRGVDRGVYREEIFEGLDIGELMRLDILRKAPGDRMYYFTDSIDYMHLYMQHDIRVPDNALRGALDNFLHRKIFDSKVRQEVVDIIAKIVKREISGEQVTGDMHLGNFKIVLDNNELKVIFVADAGVCLKPEKEIQEKVAEWEMESMVAELHTHLDYAVSEEEVKRLLEEADRELDGLKVKALSAISEEDNISTPAATHFLGTPVRDARDDI